MIAQVTAAALASENKSLAHPSSVDSLPTSANQEDHVSMATYGARRLGDMAANTAVVVGIEAMAAAQGIEFHRPLKSSPLVEQELARIRARVAFVEADRYLAPDIEAMKQWVVQGDAGAGCLRRFGKFCRPTRVDAPALSPSPSPARGEGSKPAASPTLSGGSPLPRAGEGRGRGAALPSAITYQVAAA